MVTETAVKECKEEVRHCKSYVNQSPGMFLVFNYAFSNLLCLKSMFANYQFFWHIISYVNNNKKQLCITTDKAHIADKIKSF